MEQEISILLKEYGLDENEIKIYLFLVGNKELTAYRIAKETKIHRSTCYDVLERLILKGFVSKIEKSEKDYYFANEITRVISSLKSKETILVSLISKLSEIPKKQETKIRVLDGINGQKEYNFGLFNLIKNKEIDFCYMIGNTYASSLSSNLFIERLIKDIKRINKKIDYKGIWNPKFKNDKIIKQYNLMGENRFLEIPSVVGTVIHNKGVAYLYTIDGPYVIEIKNKLIAEEMKVYFEELWENSKK